MSTFPNPCCRCGFCCISETCPAGQGIFGVGKSDPCPGFSFQDGLAVCQVALISPEQIGVGAGCCIKARAIAKGVTYDFAMLPPHIKRALAQGVMK